MSRYRHLRGITAAFSMFFAIAGCDQGGPNRAPAAGDPPTRTWLGAVDAPGYARAESPREFRFPADHGAHPDFRSEWWYVTGNLEAASGRHFGFQFTLFRLALRPDQPTGASDWRTRQMYMGHFALSDVAGERFHAAERFARGAVGLAGVETGPFVAWLEGWRMAATGAAPFPVRLEAAQDEFRIDLSLTPRKPIVLQGEDGLSRKSAERGNASYYYSLTRLAAEGTLAIAGEPFQVSGLAWLDREWSTSALAENQLGWDWFALQLDDGRDLMLYRLRNTDGGIDPASAGTLVGVDGEVTRLSREDVEVTVNDRWTSPKTGVTYPGGWDIALPGQDLQLTVEPWLADQELDLSVRYWEGAVRVRGSAAGGPVAGNGYVELAGYGEEPAPAVLR